MGLAHAKSIAFTIVIAWCGALCAQDFSFRSEFIPTQLVEDGTPIRLELLIRKPRSPGPYPTVVFNHGSTGRGDNPSLFLQSWTHLDAAKVFNEKGWMVVFPQRRGRGQSNGKYDEGFEPDRSRYSCRPDLSLAGLERAIVDLDEVVAHLKTRPDVRHDRLLIAGQSRGGILSIAYAGVRPEVFTGAVNFVGGWISERCRNVGAINTATFRRGAAFKRPTLWLYGEADPFYSISHSKDNFEAFKAAGGTGTFHAYTVPGHNSGHGLISYPYLWQVHLSEYLRTLDY